MAKYEIIRVLSLFLKTKRARKKKKYFFFFFFFFFQVVFCAGRCKRRVFAFVTFVETLKYIFLQKSMATSRTFIFPQTRNAL